MFKAECKKQGWRDIRHRSANAATKFGAKAPAAYKRIAKARTVKYRDFLLSKEKEEFRFWCNSVDPKFWSAALIYDVHG